MPLSMDGSSSTTKTDFRIGKVVGLLVLKDFCQGTIALRPVARVPESPCQPIGKDQLRTLSDTLSINFHIVLSYRIARQGA
jgi:hypothetical protein